MAQTNRDAQAKKYAKLRAAGEVALNIKVKQRTWDQYDSVYPSKNAGASLAVNAWYYLRQGTIPELKGKFTQKELEIILHSFEIGENDPVLNFEPDALYHRVRWVAEQYEYDAGYVDSIVKKFSALTAAQRFFLIDWSVLFWTKANAKPSSEYVESLL